MARSAHVVPQLRKRFRRGRRPFYEVVCRCDAYGFPHRFGSGYCDGSRLVSYFWERKSCGDCLFRDYDDWSGTPECQVINGREAWSGCEQLQEFLRENEAYTRRLPKR